MAIPMIGKRFGMLVVIKEAGSNQRGPLFECQCDCGNKAIFPGKDLRSGNNKSCGCLRHGMEGTRPYHIWGNMKKRCNNTNSPDYQRYGGRGIKYCHEWESFINFWNDMKEGYEDHLTLDRKDVNGNYAKENCRWVDLKTQQNNRRDNLILEYKGKTYTTSELAEYIGMNFSTLKTRLHKGYTVEDAVKPNPKLEELTYDGETKTVNEWAKEYGMTYHQLKKRLMRGWDAERAITQPLRKR